MFWFISRALKPALKIFSICDGLSCKLNIGHFSFSCNMFWYIRRALKPALKIFGISVGLSYKLNIPHFSSSCSMFWFISRALKPALKLFGVSVGLLWKHNIGHSYVLVYKWRIEASIEDIKYLCWFVVLIKHCTLFFVM